MTKALACNKWWWLHYREIFWCDTTAGFSRSTVNTRSWCPRSLSCSLTTSIQMTSGDHNVVMRSWDQTLRHNCNQPLYPNIACTPLTAVTSCRPIAIARADAATLAMQLWCVPVNVLMWQLMFYALQTPLSRAQNFFGQLLFFRQQPTTKNEKNNFVLFIKRKNEIHSIQNHEVSEIWAFYRAMLRRARLWYCMSSVRPSVRLSVTLEYVFHTIWNTSKIISRPNSLRSLLTLTPTWAIWYNANTPKIRVE